MKVVRNILKWLLCVILTFTTVFTINMLYEEGVGGLLIRLNPDKYEQEFKDNSDEAVKSYDEMVNSFFTYEEYEDVLNPNENTSNPNEERFLAKYYKEYPAGTLYLLETFVMSYRMGGAILYASVTALILGTAIFFLINSKEKKGFKLIIVSYIVSIILVGTIVGIENNVDDKLNIIKSWEFPTEYIIPITVAFGLVIAVRVIKQKDLASKLNTKLKERKK